ncbi:MAG: FkbM family methyltransferase, partial [Burkholderiales bacterium]|nr:FkbM family methyltransferase [Phycisphaerae bacterium]
MALSLQYDEAKVVFDYFARHPREPRRAIGNAGVMVDVGAHFGTSLRPYLAQGWRVIAFEPDSTKLPKLQPYFASPNLTFFRAAVGDQATEAVQFYTSPESTGIASLVPFRESHTPSETVAITTLSIELPKLGIATIDYLKIDTEGYDLQVLRGHDWSVRPEVIMCEFDEIKTRPQGFTYRALGDLLLAHDYQVYCSQWAPLLRYGSGHAWHSVLRYPCELHHADAWGNFIAVHSYSHVATMESLIAPHMN